MNSVWRANELTFFVVAAPRVFVELDAAEVEDTRARRAIEPRADRIGPSILDTICIARAARQYCGIEGLPSCRVVAEVLAEFDEVRVVLASTSYVG